MTPLVFSLREHLALQKMQSNQSNKKAFSRKRQMIKHRSCSTRGVVRESSGQNREAEDGTVAPVEVTLKYMGSTLCLMAWAFPTRASTDDTFSGSWRFSTTELMAFITLRAWCRSWLLRSISSGSSMSWNWLKYCLADGKLTKNLRRAANMVLF